jgi:hypothetical protein
MKQILMILAVVLSINAYAQPRIGVEYSLAQTSVLPSPDAYLYNVSSNFKTANSIGLAFETNITKYGIFNIGAKSMSENYSYTSDNKYVINYNYTAFRVPISFMGNLPIKNFSLSFGLGYAYEIFKCQYLNYSNQCDVNWFGVVGSIGYKYKQFRFSINPYSYSGRFTTHDNGYFDQTQYGATFGVYYFM